MAEVVERAVVGRTHRPCGACGGLVWIPEGCEHMRPGKAPLRARRGTPSPRPPRPPRKTQRQVEDNVRERARRDIAFLL